ncbi:phage-related terminase-small subunit [Secundilactobacillus pentosiphilus]|uniref:Phage-related terminase-small subunit n=1 Tax=Secundilactobacillus pentosiphilus TaxID=1714682 RepID=A0A1Z5IYT5_9LACO|nr:phage terminase small subunit P27 family [Secundilactobacillus pentosiphilus]GAX06954.1 phage-related terminase-small subunit [Secundilactobacillus pentosiphilus]
MPQVAKSAMIHLLEGNPNNLTKKELHKRSENEKKLQIASNHIDPPAWLSTGAKNEFKRIVTLFEPTKLLTEADVNLLAVYCNSLMDYKAYKAQIKKRGYLVKGRLNPFIHEKQKTADLLNKYANQIGLTPSARASLAINMDSKEDDDDEDF